MVEKRINYSLKNKRIWIVGHNGMVGSAILRKLKRLNCQIQICQRKDVDLRSQPDVLNWMKKKKTRGNFFSRSESWRYLC